MKTQYYTATSIDGFIATEDDSLDWLFPLGNLSDTSYPAFFAEVGALAMGATTYQWILDHSGAWNAGKCSQAGRAEEVRYPMQFLVVIEQGPSSYGAYVPDLPGCVAVGDTREEVTQLIHDAIEFHLEGMKEEGLPIPQPHSFGEFVEVRG